MDKSDIIEILLASKAKSHAIKRKVGALIILDNNELIIGPRFNYTLFGDKCENADGLTFNYVVHAEESVIFDYLKCTTSVERKKHSHLYTTFSPCYNCCKLIIQAGINEISIVDMHEFNFENPTMLDEISPRKLLEHHNIKINHLSKNI